MEIWRVASYEIVCACLKQLKTRRKQYYGNDDDVNLTLYSSILLLLSSVAVK